MQVKKFEAPTIQDALDTIKRELGPEAIILQTKKNKRGFGLLSKSSIEITAAVSARSIEKKKVLETRLKDETKETVHKMPAERQANLYNKYMDQHLERIAKKTKDDVQVSTKPESKMTQTRYIDILDADGDRSKAQPNPSQDAFALREEVHSLKKMIEEIKNRWDENEPGSGAQAHLAANQSLNTPALQDGFDQLLVNGVDRRLALQLVKRVAFELGDEHSKNPEKVLDQIANEILQTTEVISLLDGLSPHSVIALVGTTGVGKTASIAKIAGQAIFKKKLKTGLIHFNLEGEASFDQLAIFAKILNAPFRVASSVEDLKSCVMEFQGLDLVLIDTNGFSQRDESELQKMENALNSLAQVKAALVLPVSMRDGEMLDIVKRFSVFKPQGLVFTKLDEATVFGAVYNLNQKTKIPLLYFSTGQRIPDDLEEATRERVVSLVMDL